MPGTQEPGSSQSSSYNPNSSPSQPSEHPSPQLPERTHATSHPPRPSPYSLRHRLLLRIDTSSSSLAETSSAPPTFGYSPPQQVDAYQGRSPHAAAGSSYQHLIDGSDSSFDDHHHGDCEVGTLYPPPDLHLSPVPHPSPQHVFAAPPTSPQQVPSTFDDPSLLYSDP